MGEMKRWDVMQTLIDHYGYRSYLEIGYHQGENFDKINCTNKIAVDPDPCKTDDMKNWMTLSNIGYSKDESWGIFPTKGNPNTKEVIFKCTSDEFFEDLPEDTTFDLIFIDGLHERRQVSRDIFNGVRHLTDGGCIVLHDTCPPTYLHTTSGHEGSWTGDVYKEAAWEMTCFFDQECYTVETDWGVTVLFKKSYMAVDPFDHNEKQSINQLRDKLANDWNYFDENRDKLLRIISPNDFLNKYNNGKLDYFEE